MRAKGEEVRDLERVLERKSQGAWRPLQKRTIASIPNWHQWLDRFDCADDLRTMDSLLHIGYDVLLAARSPDEPTDYGQTDRHRLYMTIADGWSDPLSLRAPGDEDRRDHCYDGYSDDGRMIVLSQDQARQRIALKAFHMLCLRFFKKVVLRGGGRHNDDFNDLWFTEIVTDTMLPKIMWFFRPEDTFDTVRIRNLSSHPEDRTHQEGFAINFLLNLAQFLWGWKERSIAFYLNDQEKAQVQAYNIKFRALVDSAKPWMVEVLHYLRRLDVLDKWSLDLDQACLDKLKEIALRCHFRWHQYEHLVSSDRAVASLEEACLVGSPAAWFLKRRDIMIRERDRLMQIREAEQQAHEAAARLEQLSHPTGSDSR